MNFLKSLFGSSSEAVVDQTFSGDAKPYGVDKKAKDCTWEEIQKSKESFWDDHSEGIVAWRIDAALDFKSTKRDLFVDGMEADDPSKLPEFDGMRVTVLPITSMARNIEAMDGDKCQSSLVICAETLEELHAIPGIRLYKAKTKKKETGKCYFKGAFDYSYQRGCAAGAFLLHANHLTRVLVLGKELATAFEAACISSDTKSQQWIKQNLSD